MTQPAPQTDVARFVRACEQHLRRPALQWDGTATVAVFSPDLTPAEQAVYTAILRWHRAGIGLSFPEFLALRDDMALLRNYLGVATPTAAQTAAATKSVIRVLRGILD